ncbi:hypothetical protein [uncultured Rikenella sp.]|uniref:hypothetical protein n=1 Tax=uncultured Rikenella sp. TaxID=368003 RepID=UPI0025E9779F|nr:hypothetical protein [uncultured Rikenella sp.]
MKRRITENDYLRANRRASRNEEIAAHGHPVGVRRIHRSKKQYDRKKMKAGLKSLPDFYPPILPLPQSAMLSVFGLRK